MLSPSAADSDRPFLANRKGQGRKIWLFGGSNVIVLAQ